MLDIPLLNPGMALLQGETLSSWQIGPKTFYPADLTVPSRAGHPGSPVGGQRPAGGEPDDLLLLRRKAGDGSGVGQGRQEGGFGVLGFGDKARLRCTRLRRRAERSTISHADGWTHALTISGPPPVTTGLTEAGLRFLQIRTMDAYVHDLLYGDGVTTAWATQRWYGEILTEPGSMVEPYLREAGPPTNIPEAVRSGSEVTEPEDHDRACLEIYLFLTGRMSGRFIDREWLSERRSLYTVRLPQIPQVSRRCGCVDAETGRQRGVTCPCLLVDDDHGSWYFAVQVRGLGGQRQRVRRGGYAAPEEAQAAGRALADADRDTAQGPDAPSGNGWHAGWPPRTPSGRRPGRATPHTSTSTSFHSWDGSCSTNSPITT
ncbi:hypothetical protein ACIBQX_48500 [Nonomuraea sp. NPDC049714]|uniref:hypothetical protein n=1 Tax=Nonomuraea sp. NPDC049714 TaxID=3364357 RepID=UPI0037BB2032